MIQKILHEFHPAILHSPLISLLPASLLGHPCSWSLQHDSGQNNVFEVGTALFQPPTPCAKFPYHKCFLISSVSIYLFVNTTPNVWRLFGGPNSPKTKMVNPSWLESGRRISKGMLPSDDSQWLDISTSFVPKTRNILFLNSSMHPSNKPQKNVEVPWAQSPQAERSVQVSLVLTHISSIYNQIATVHPENPWIYHPQWVSVMETPLPRPTTACCFHQSLHRSPQRHHNANMPLDQHGTEGGGVGKALPNRGAPKNINMEMCIFLDSTAPPAETVFLPWSCI